jgi:hypothetical protein
VRPLIRRHAHGSRRFSSLTFLALTLMSTLAACAHAPASAPPGMAGTCRTWARDGKVLAAGPHKIELDARSPPTREGECCLEQTVALTLLSGQVHTEEFRLNVIEYPD